MLLTGLWISAIHIQSYGLAVKEYPVHNGQLRSHGQFMSSSQVFFQGSVVNQEVYFKRKLVVWRSTQDFTKNLLGSVLILLCRLASCSVQHPTWPRHLGVFLDLLGHKDLVLEQHVLQLDLLQSLALLWTLLRNSSLMGYSMYSSIQYIKGVPFCSAWWCGCGSFGGDNLAG